MRKPLSLCALVAGLAILCTLPGYGQRPLVSYSYTPDPAPFVHDGKVYMATGHDEDDAT